MYFKNIFIKSKINIKNFANAISLPLPLTLPARSFATVSSNPPSGGPKTLRFSIFDTADFNVFLTKFLSFNISYGIYDSYLDIIGNNDQFIVECQNFHFFYEGSNNIKDLYNTIKDLSEEYLKICDFDYVNDIYIELNIKTIDTF